MSFHVLRHTFASILIDEGHDVVFVSRQLGHADPSITLKVYAHLFDAERHAGRARERLEAEYGALISRPQRATPRRSVPVVVSHFGEAPDLAIATGRKEPHRSVDVPDPE